MRVPYRLITLATVLLIVAGCADKPVAPVATGATPTPLPTPITLSSTASELGITDEELARIEADVKADIEARRLAEAYPDPEPTTSSYDGDNYTYSTAPSYGVIDGDPSTPSGLYIDPSTGGISAQQFTVNPSNGQMSMGVPLP